MAGEHDFAPARTRGKGVRTRSPWGSWHKVPADALLPYPVAQSLADRTVFWWLRRCPVCQQTKPMLARRATCGHNCKGVLIAIKRSPEHTAHMQRVSHAATRERTELADLAQLLGDVAEEDTTTRVLVVRAYRAGRKRGYRLGETGGTCRERRAWEEGRR